MVTRNGNDRRCFGRLGRSCSIYHNHIMLLLLNTLTHKIKKVGIMQWRLCKGLLPNPRTTTNFVNHRPCKFSNSKAWTNIKIWNIHTCISGQRMNKFVSGRNNTYIIDQEVQRIILRTKPNATRAILNKTKTDLLRKVMQILLHK